MLIVCTSTWNDFSSKIDKRCRCVSVVLWTGIFLLQWLGNINLQKEISDLLEHFMRLYRWPRHVWSRCNPSKDDKLSFCLVNKLLWAGQCIVFMLSVIFVTHTNRLIRKQWHGHSIDSSQLWRHWKPVPTAPRSRHARPAPRAIRHAPL